VTLSLPWTVPGCRRTVNLTAAIRTAVIGALPHAAWTCAAAGVRPAPPATVFHASLCSLKLGTPVRRVQSRMAALHWSPVRQPAAAGAPLQSVLLDGLTTHRCSAQCRCRPWIAEFARTALSRPLRFALQCRGRAACRRDVCRCRTPTCPPDDSVSRVAVLCAPCSVICALWCVLCALDASLSSVTFRNAPQSQSAPLSDACQTDVPTRSSETQRGAPRAGPGARRRKARFLGQVRLQVPGERVARPRRESGPGLPAHPARHARRNFRLHSAVSHASGRRGAGLPEASREGRQSQSAPL